MSYPEEYKIDKDDYLVLIEAEHRKETCEMFETDGIPFNEAASKEKAEACMVIAAINNRSR